MYIWYVSKHQVLHSKFTQFLYQFKINQYLSTKQNKEESYNHYLYFKVVFQLQLKLLTAVM